MAQSYDRDQKQWNVHYVSYVIAKNIIYLPFKCKLKYNCAASYKPHLQQLLCFLAQLLVQILLLFLQLAPCIDAILAIWLVCQLLQLVCATQTASTRVMTANS